MFATLAVLMAAILYVMFLIVSNESEIAAAENRRLESYKLADELRQTSDDLTRMARTYVVSGDARYLAYFNRIVEHSRWRSASSRRLQQHLLGFCHRDWAETPR